MDKYGEIIAAAKMDNRSSRFFKAAYRKCYSAALFERDKSRARPITYEAWRRRPLGERMVEALSSVFAWEPG